MTEKQIKILEAALRLFGTEGYKSTSTKKVAAAAGVSDGLIFRHFKNKEGLLKAVLAEGESRGKKYMAEVVLATDPQKVIKRTIELPFEIIKAEKEFWRLQYLLKWQEGRKESHKMDPLILSLTNAFEKLGYKQPELEAKLLMVYIDGIFIELLTKDNFESEELLTFIKNKYKV